MLAHAVSLVPTSHACAEPEEEELDDELEDELEEELDDELEEELLEEDELLDDEPFSLSPPVPPQAVKTKTALTNHNFDRIFISALIICINKVRHPVGKPTGSLSQRVFTNDLTPCNA